jgi:type IV secretion system protein VirD4
MPGGRLDPPLLLLLDEAANIAPLPDLDVVASTGPGQGVQLLTVLQDLAQAYDRWGRDRADTILNNHRGKLFGSGLSDERTLDALSRLLGEGAVRNVSATRGERGRNSTTESTSHRPLMPTHVVRQLPTGSAVLVYGNLPPARVALVPWFTDRRLKTLARPSAAEHAPAPRASAR